MIKKTFLTLTTLLTPTQVFAQDKTEPGVNLGDAFLLGERGGTTTKVAETFPNISSILAVLLPNAFILAGLIIFFIILGAGFVYIKSGSSNEDKDKAKQALSGAIMGLALIFASYWIIQIIEVVTGVPILNPTFTTN